LCKWGITVTMPVHVWTNHPNYPEKYKLIDREIDACLAPLIYKLNNNGVRTLNCCCNHRQDWRYNTDQVMDKNSHGGILIDSNCVRHAEALGYEPIMRGNAVEIRL